MSSRADGRAGSPFPLRGCRARISTCRLSPRRRARRIIRRGRRRRLRAGQFMRRSGASAAPRRARAFRGDAARLRGAAPCWRARVGLPADGTIGGGSTGRGAMPGGNGARTRGSANGRGSGRVARVSGSGRAYAGRDGLDRRRCPGVRPRRAADERRLGALRGAVGARHRNVARRIDRHGAHDVLLDHEVARAADQQEMFDIVAPHQHEAAPSIDRRGIDHRETRLAATLRGRRRRATPPKRRMSQKVSPMRASTITNATTKRTISEPSAPNKLSIRSPLRSRHHSRPGPNCRPAGSQFPQANEL